MDILKVLREGGGYYDEKHFVYTSGRHGEVYVNVRVLKGEELRQQLKACSLALLEKAISVAGLDTTKQITVVGPETLGAILAQVACTAYHEKHAGAKIYAVSLQAVRQEGGSKHYEIESEVAAKLLENSQNIYFDDVMNVASTWKQCKPLIEKFGLVMVIATVIDRSGLSAEMLGVPRFVNLAEVPATSHPADDCPLCHAQKPIVTNLGHGNKFREANPNYPGGFTEI
jgi:orotate phosphoribosyltransferase